MNKGFRVRMNTIGCENERAVVDTAVNLVDDLLMWLLVVFIMRKFLKRQAVDLKKNF